jgi:RNA polymerase sigma-70 factor (ECF subfamily)
MTDALGQRSTESLADELLVIRCQLGERDAFDALVLRWHRPLWAYVHRLLGDDSVSPDVTQDVWLRVVRGIARLRDPQKLRAWLFGIARRAVMDHLRARYAVCSEVAVDVSELPDLSADLSDNENGAAEMILAQLDDALRLLPVVEREVLVLFYLKELSLSELAEVLAVPVGTVKSRLHRARRLLRQHVTPEGRFA